MRKLHVFVLLFVFGISGAQIIAIPDPAFKNALVNTNCASTGSADYVDVDSNNDGEIEMSEIAQVQALFVPDAGISSLEGIQHFTPLVNLVCYNNQLTSLDVSMLPNLFKLDCHNNQIGDLNVGNGELSVIDCSYNNLTSLDLSNLTFRELFCSHNQLTEINAQFLDNYGYWFDPSYNLLTDLQIPYTGYNIEYIDISGNLYTSIDVPHVYISYFSCNDSQITSLDLSNVQHYYNIYLNNNAHLQHINMRNGYNDYCANYDDFTDECIPLDDCQISNLPALQTVCMDEDEIPYFSLYFNDPNVSLTTYCEFTPPNYYNTITGHISFDQDGDGCSENEQSVANLPINLNTFATNLGATFTNQNGNFVYYPNGNVTLTPQYENPYYSVTPAFYTTTFTGYGNTDNINFCVAANGIHPDLEVAIISTQPARPGFDASYKIVYKNKGTQTQSGNVTLNFADAILDYVSANPATDAQSANLLTWNFVNLAPFETREIIFTINVNSPMETPAVNIGDLLEFSASVNSQTDETPNDNTAALSQTVVGSFDPNDKMVAEGAFINPTQLGDYLHYTIRFQNTGTFAAENVVVKDMLASNFDLTSLQILSASHPYRATLTPGNKLEFFFENIQLPPVTENEPGSHGYVTFKIKPKNTVVVGNTLENKAEIYFDFNFPIVTNTVTTAVAPLGTKAFEKTLLTVYPNPASAVLNIVSDSKINTIEISNNLGQTVLKSQNTDSVDVSRLSAGVYFIKAVAAKGNSTQKFIKL